MREYEKTHPWIKFELALGKFDHKLWVFLGKAVSKCEHLATVPLQPDTYKSLHTLYLAKGIHATTAIEGNTLSEEDVIKRLEGKLDLPPSREYLGKEIDNIANGCGTIAKELLETGMIGTSPSEIMKFNEIVLAGLPLNEEVIPGKIRKHKVGVFNYRGAPPNDCEFLLDKLCKWLNGLSIDYDNAILSGLLKAVLAHVYIAWIHPFGDGNGRTARLLEFKLLLASGVPTPAAHLLSNHYNLTRSEYYRQLEFTSKSGGDLIPFVRYAVIGFVDGLKGQIQELQRQHLAIAWEKHIYDSFKDKSGPINDRRRRLALDLTKKDEAVRLDKIRELSPAIAEHYANKTLRTIRRDILELLGMKLIRMDASGIKANVGKMLSLMPKRIRENN